MRMYDIIEKKRDGKKLSGEEIGFFISEYTAGRIPDYQASALLMTIFLNGMDMEETTEMTLAMANSGDMIDLSAIRGIKVDKHSTGGVGDKTTLIVGPLVAACGVPMAKMSGRGLGHTGGTIDKLEAIPGFQTGLTRGEFIRAVNENGIAVVGQTGNMVPADKKLYALRDVTATVNHIALIASSIMSKKIAAGADRIVLDVKTGSGAFMKTLDTSIALAQAMVNIGAAVGRKTTALITDMDIPLGNAIGNSLEVIEAIETLKGRGPDDLREICLQLASHILHLAGAGTLKECRSKAEEALERGEALRRLSRMIALQGGDSRVIEDYSIMGTPRHICYFRSEHTGYIRSVQTEMLGKAAVILGAGRETKESQIDYTAGLMLHAKPGTYVAQGDILAELYAVDEEKLAQATAVLKESYTFGNTVPKGRSLVLAVVDADGVHRVEASDSSQV